MNTLNARAAALVLLAAAPVWGQSAETDLQQALDRPIELSVSDAPIGEVFGKLSKASGVKFVISTETLEAMPYGGQTRLDVTLRNVTLRKALTPMLSQHALAWEITDSEVHVVPTEALFRMCRRATYDELKLLGKLHTARLKPERDVLGVLSQLREATGNEQLNIAFHVKTDREEAFKRAGKVLPGTIVEWLNMLCHGKGWTWYIWGDDITIVDSALQVERQLQRQVSLRYQNAELMTVLMDLAQKARVKLIPDPGVMNLLPLNTRKNFSLIMADAPIAQALDFISGTTGLVFFRTAQGIRVTASEQLASAQPATQPERRRAPFFIRMSMPGPEPGTTIDVIIPADELPADVREKIEAEKDRLIEHLRKESESEGG